MIYLISLSLSYLSLIYLEEESHCVLRLSPLDIHAVHAGVLTLEGLRCGAQARASRQNRTELFTKRNRDERATTNTATTVRNGETVKRQASEIARNTPIGLAPSEDRVRPRARRQPVVYTKYACIPDPWDSA